jgi:S-adenosylmethionine:tRNA ribosyltransferase-isomerase
MTMHPKKISIKDYTYDLPEEKIARYPLSLRDASKLLIYQKGKITEDVYSNLDTHLPEDSLLVFNDTKVVEARILFQKLTGGAIEIFCLEPGDQYPDITLAMSQKGTVQWKCLVGGASKWKRGQLLEKKLATGDKEVILHGKYIERRSDYFIIELSWSPASMSFAELLHHAGAIPLPPYLNRKPEITDAERYQTIYAQMDGSVAAPTAGLHFTDALFKKLGEKNIQPTFITLHVGAGTFKPVKSETLEDHDMHAEFIDVTKDSIETILQHTSHKIIATGTTSLRTLESLYWLGVKTILFPDQTELQLTQWEPYELSDKNIPVETALKSLLDWMEKNKKERLITRTQILIAPGYRIKMIDGLLTNFHQPNSTLLLLVAALTGGDWRKIYDYALTNDFRFLSYGDGSLLWV